MRVAITGDREWEDGGTILHALSRLNRKEDFVILGDARGADTWARIACESLGLNHRVFRADWEKQGRAAGPIRNRAMLVDGKAEELWYFHDDLSQSKGTKNCVLQAKRLGVVVRDGTGREAENPSLFS